MSRMRSQARKQYGIAADDQREAIITRVSNAVHGVGRHFEYPVKDEGAALEKDVSPVPAVIFDDVVGFGLDPEVKCDENDSTDPAQNVGEHGEVGRDSEAGKGKHDVGEEVTMSGMVSKFGSEMVRVGTRT